MNSWARRRACLAGLLVLVGPSAPAQILGIGNPKFKLLVTHPPKISLSGVIAITTIRDRDTGWRCGADIESRLTQAFVNSQKFEVAARTQLDQIRNEVSSQLNPEKGFDERTKTKLLKILGPGALVFGEVNACETNVVNERTTKQRLLDKTPRPWAIARTSAYVGGSLQLVELSSGRLYSALAIEGRHEMTNEAAGESVASPDKNITLNQAIDKAVAEFMKTVLPWSESVEVLVYDDEKWGLKKGAAFLKASEFERAAEIFKEAVAAGAGAASDAKMLAKAHHNLGITLMYSGHADDGLASLLKALELNPKGPTQEAILRCREMISSQQKFVVQETQGIAIGASSSTPAGKCVKCSSPLAAGAKFCPNCGHKVQSDRCPNTKCGAKLDPKDKFCSVCGTRVRE